MESRRASSPRPFAAIRRSRTDCIGRPRGTSPAARSATWWPQASLEGRALGAGERPQPFYGYYFRILTAQGAAAPGGAKSYLVNGEMSGGFALVAWPATYDATGVMTFVVNQNGVVYQKDLGPRTESAVAGIATYNPGASWHRVP